MICKKCYTNNAPLKKCCSNCGAFLEGATINNTTGEYGYRNADGSFTTDHPKEAIGETINLIPAHYGEIPTMQSINPAKEKEFYGLLEKHNKLLEQTRHACNKIVEAIFNQIEFEVKDGNLKND